MCKQLLRKQLRNSDESESESDTSQPTHSGNLQLDEITLQLVDYAYEAIWWMQNLDYYVILVYELSCKQQETHSIRDRDHFVVPGHLPIRQQYHLWTSLQYHPDRTSISEGDVVLFKQASFRNLRQSSLLVTTKMYSQMDLQNKNQNGLPESVPAWLGAFGSA